MGSMAAMHDETTLKDNIEEYVSHYLQQRLMIRTAEGEERPVTKDDEMFGWAFTLAVEMFHAGAEFADNTSHRENKSIIINH